MIFYANFNGFGGSAFVDLFDKIATMVIHIVRAKDLMLFIEIMPLYKPNFLNFIGQSNHKISFNSLL